MTTTERATEHRHILETRLAALAGAGKPTADQIAIATQEADDHIAALDYLEWLAKPGANEPR